MSSHFSWPPFGGSDSWSAEHKLISFDNMKSYKLYDLRKDKGESTDVAAKHPKIVKTMGKILERWVKSCTRSAKGEDYKK